jgi:hypothetical protein
MKRWKSIFILDDDEFDFLLFVMLDANLTLFFQSLDKKERKKEKKVISVKEV